MCQARQGAKRCQHNTTSIQSANQRRDINKVRNAVRSFNSPHARPTWPPGTMAGRCHGILLPTTQNQTVKRQNRTATRARANNCGCLKTRALLRCIVRTGGYRYRPPKQRPL